MPAQVVVVKRSRRRVFAILRIAPAWLRAFFETARARTRRSAEIDLAGIFPHPTLPGLAWERLSGVSTPNLIAKAELDNCAECRRCVVICPSRALHLEVETPASVAEIVRFDLDAGRCIGCGECARVCPDRLLEMNVSELRIGAGADPLPRSLLSDAHRAFGG
jgi:ferredoxin